MSSVNKVILVGRLGAEPELRTANNGKAVCKFTLATDSGWGENKQTDWHRVIAFDKLADSCGKYLAKGRQVYLEGRVSYRKWEKDDGTTQWFTEILANDVQFLGDSPQNASGQRSQQPQGQRPQQPQGQRPQQPQGQRSNQGQQRTGGNYGGPAQGQGGWDGFADDDIPF